jgi:hypothetical protein
LEIAQLQKGLVLVFCGNEIIEEGAGFGVPIVKYSDNTYFSSTAQVYLEFEGSLETVYTKVFFLDSISRKQIRGAFINDVLYSIFHGLFEKLYLKRKNLRPLFDWMMLARGTVGIQTRFEIAPSKGKVIVTYRCSAQGARIRVDLSELDKNNCEEILILNEQGASVFRRYVDSDKNFLEDGAIEGWATVKAKKASFCDPNRGLLFSLQNLKGAQLFRGREQINGRFSWAGMTYSIDPMSKEFEYYIEVTHEGICFS